jgi:hypothetical protein
MDETVRNTLAAAALGLFSWHLLTLHNISRSVDVLVEQMGMSNSRIERLENHVTLAKKMSQGKSKSAKYYASNAKARAKKNEYQRKLNKKPAG